LSFIDDSSTTFNPLRLRYFLLLGTLVTLVYVWGTPNPFHYDDLHSIRDNPHIRTLSNIPAFFTHPEYFTSDPRSAMYRPLLLVSYTLNYALDKLQVRSYHWVNIAIHVVNSGLVLVLAQYLFRRSAVALMAAIVFALHPVNSEVVNYISSRSESLCALFLLVSFIAYMRARATAEDYDLRDGADRLLAYTWTRTTVGLHMPMYGLALMAFVGSLLCKAVAVVLLPLLVVYEICFPQRAPSWRMVVGRLVPFAAIALVYMVAMRQMLHTALVEAPVREAWVQWATQVKALAYYIKLLCYPWALNIEHQFSLGGAEPVVWVSVALVFSILAWAWRSGAAVRFFVFWFFIALAPTFVVPLNVLVNEHRLYLPSVAFAMGLACGLERLWRSSKAGAICCVLLALAYGGLDIQRTLMWLNAQTLWGQSLAKSPRMPRPQLYMGNVHKEAGRHEEALVSYVTALKVQPEILSGGDMVSIYNNIGATYLAMGRFSEARIAYEKTLQIDPEYELAQESLEALMALKNEDGQAEAEVLQRRGLIALVQGRVEEAVALFVESLAQRPLGQTYLVLAQAYERLQKVPSAQVAYRDLIALESVGPRVEEARRRLQALEHRVSGNGVRP